MVKILLIHCFLIIASFAAAHEVNIRDYGAKGDGITLDTYAIQKAIDACAEKGGGRVIFPEGTFLSGTIELRDNIVCYFENGARLLGSTNIEDYRNLDPFTEGLGIQVGWALLVAVDRKNIGIEGKGIIDGQGAKLKAAQVLKDTRPESQRWGRRPFLLRIVRCTGVRVVDITLHYAGAWTSNYAQSKNIEIKNVKILSVGVAHNDGIGIDGCQNVRISDCDVTSGDDALVFKTTSANMACKNIVVNNMRLKSNQAGIKIGTESIANFENIRIENCYIHNTRNGGIKLLSVDGAQIKNVLISDVKMLQVRTPILLRLGSRLSVFRKGQDKQQQTGFFEQVVLKNISAVSTDSTQLKSASGILLTGVPGHKLSGVTLENIVIELPGGGSRDEALVKVPEAVRSYPEVKTFGPVIPAYGLWARHVQDLTVKGLQFRLRSNDQRPAILLEDAAHTRLQHVVVPFTHSAVTCMIRTSTGTSIDGWKAAGDAPLLVKADDESRGSVQFKNNRLPVGQKQIN